MTQITHMKVTAKFLDEKGRVYGYRDGIACRMPDPPPAEQKPIHPAHSTREHEVTCKNCKRALAHSFKHMKVKVVTQ